VERARRASPATTSQSRPAASGRRVLSADYTDASLALDELVEHTISYPEHQVFLVDSAERLVAASPETQAVTLAQAEPELARAFAAGSHGPVPGASTASTFTSAPVPGTSWRLLIAVPDKRLYASIAGWTLFVPWLVFALVTVLGVLIGALAGGLLTLHVSVAATLALALAIGSCLALAANNLSASSAEWTRS
jgi:hypothetical protein